MEESNDELGYILSGFVFYAFGLKWCYEYAKYWLPNSIEYNENNISNLEGRKFFKFTRNCQNLIRRHPSEGTLKLFATALGLASTLTGNLPSNIITTTTTTITITTVSPKVVHATIYLFFALSGLVDVLTFYFPNIVSDGLSKMALAQSFFIEGFLFLWGSTQNNFIIYVILTAIVWTTTISIILELVWPETKLLRSFSTILHGGWLAHMVRNNQIYNAQSIERITLTFSWHFATAFVITLIIIAVTRSCAPKRNHHNNPPEIPIYDYCHQQEQRV